MVKRLRALIKAGRYRVTLHAEQERDADQILMSEIEEAFTDRESVILEDYPDDPRGHSALVLARIIHEASAASADTRLRRAVSPFSPSTYCTSMP